MKVIRRRAVARDADSIAELYLRARRAAARVGAIPPLVHGDDDVARWVAGVVIQSMECWVAESAQGAIVGMLVLGGDAVDQLYVRPDLTGRGIGAALILLAKRERPAGLRLLTFVSNEGAQRFYLRHRFREVQRTDGTDNEEGAPDIEYAWGSD